MFTCFNERQQWNDNNQTCHEQLKVPVGLHLNRVINFLFRYVQKHEDRSAIFPNMPTAFIGFIPHLPSAIPTILHVFRWFAMKHTRKCISFRKCGKCFREKWGWKYVLVKQPSSRRKEMFDGLNQVKGFEQSKWSKQCKPAHHFKKNVGNK